MVQVIQRAASQKSDASPKQNTNKGYVFLGVGQVVVSWIFIISEKL
jgi:hypothetical protein